jgi:predicted aspartyl protease
VDHFNVRASLTGPTGLSESIDLLVDTGATFIVLPDAGVPLLGAVALESLLLVVDPVGKRLIPTNALAMSTSRDTVAIPA